MKTKDNKSKVLAVFLCEIGIAVEYNPNMNSAAFEQHMEVA
jgi:hypothetical protein